ncbi:unannotated protein [freshwater metagenome]|uniref:Unannotated protein n=1 Tax=freshwater metagenome TaxID=449393 RepID=A0A6J6TPZ1_9ZZZZ
MGVIIQLRVINRSALAACAPPTSRPAIGWEGTNCEIGSDEFLMWTIGSFFTLPTSIKVEFGFNAYSASMTRGIADVGSARITSSGVGADAWPLRAFAKEAASASLSTSSTSTPRAVRPRAIEVPINPDPTMRTCVSITERYLGAETARHVDRYVRLRRQGR